METKEFVVTVRRRQFDEIAYRMISENEIYGIIDFSVEEQANDVLVSYQNEAYVPLPVYFERELTRAEILRIFENYFAIMDGMAGFLLDEHQLLLDCRQIYIDPESGELRLIYLPDLACEEEVSIVAKDTRYVSNVKDVASYTTGELDPGEYRVVVVSDFVRGDKEFNWLAFDTQTKGFSVICVENVGVYNAFGVAYMDGVVVDSKKTITLNTVRQGCVLTFLLKNRDKMIGNFYNLEGTDHFKYTISGDLEEELDVLEKAWETQREWNSSVADIQYYIPAFETLFVHWQGDTLGLKLREVSVPVVTLELDFATGTITMKP